MFFIRSFQVDLKEKEELLCGIQDDWMYVVYMHMGENMIKSVEITTIGWKLTLYIWEIRFYNDRI